MHDADEMSTFLTPITTKQLVQLAAIGAVIGLLVWGLTFIFETYVFRALLCQGSQTMRCEAGADYAEGIATLISAAIGLFGLIKLHLFRSLVVVVAVTVSLWDFIGMQAGISGYMIAFMSIVLYALSYLAFGWIARIRVFWIVALLMVLLIVAIRLMLSV